MLDLYSVLIYWSPADDLFIANVPELRGCTVHGDTRAEALENAEQAIAAWIAVAKEFGDPIPEPGGKAEIAA